MEQPRLDTKTLRELIEASAPPMEDMVRLDRITPAHNPVRVIDAPPVRSALTRAVLRARGLNRRQVSDALRRERRAVGTRQAQADAVARRRYRALVHATTRAP